MLAILAVVLGIGALIGIHESCHMFLAKFFGIKVLKFSFGFGPRLLAYKTKATSYELRLLPLGGFVQFDGENPDDATGFFGLSWYKRALIALAGPVSNILIGFALIATLLIFKGWPVSVGLHKAVSICVFMIVATLKMLMGFFHGTSHVSDMSGPIGVTTIMVKSFKEGGLDFTFLLAVVSLSLGLFNLFPFPGLDGGHVALYAAEGIRGKKFPLSVYNLWNIVGLILLGLFMLLIIGMDIVKLFK